MVAANNTGTALSYIDAFECPSHHLQEPVGGAGRQHGGGGQQRGHRLRVAHAARRQRHHPLRAAAQAAGAPGWVIDVKVFLFDMF